MEEKYPALLKDRLQLTQGEPDRAVRLFDTLCWQV